MNKIEQEIIKGGDYTTVPNGVAMVKNTFWLDFGIAEKVSGLAGVRDTYDRAFDGWRDDIRYLTALYCVLNWRGCGHYGKDDKLARLYFEKQQELDKYILDYELVGGKEKYKNFNSDEIAYFLKATD